MKKLLLLALVSAISAPGLYAQAVAAPASATEHKRSPKTEKTPEERAQKDADRAAQTLGLTAGQQSKWRDASLQRIQANAPLREKMRASADKTEKHSLGRQMRDNGKKFEDTVNGFLTAEQKTKWEQEKKERRDHRKSKMKRSDVQPVPAPQD